MTYNRNYLAKVPVSVNTDFTINYSTGVGTQQGASNLWSYNGNLAGDNQAAIAAADYFVTDVLQFQINDLIFASATDSESILRVSAITYPDNNGLGAAISTVTFLGPNSITTAMIQDHAVTYAKIQQVAASTLLGNPTGSTANVSGITLDPSLQFNGTTLRVNPDLLVYKTGTLSAADLSGAYATPVQILAGQGANTTIIVDSFVLKIVYGTTQFADGGAANLQYGNTAHAGGTAATETIAAATINGWSANSMIKVAGLLGSAATTAVVNQALYLSNATASFTTGDSTFEYTLIYRVIATTP